jgi:hypothetical protein
MVAQARGLERRRGGACEMARYDEDHPVEKEKPQRLLDNAVAFHEAGGRCHAKHPLEIAPEKSTFLRSPSVVCYAFAIELYLKLLRLITAGTYDGFEHKLDKLYGQLAPEIQEKIDESYGYTGILSIKSELDDAASAFLRWRYAHEYEELAASPETLARIGATLHRVACEIRPELISAFEK